MGCSPARPVERKELGCGNGEGHEDEHPRPEPGRQPADALAGPCGGRSCEGELKRGVKRRPYSALRTVDDAPMAPAV